MMIKKTLVFILMMGMAVGLGSAGACRAQSLFDADGDDFVFEQAKEGQAQPSTPLDRFLEDAAFTLGYRFSHGTGSPASLIDNFTFFHMDFHRLISQRIFIKFDGQVRCHPKSDHRAEAKGKRVYVDPFIRESYVQAGFDDFSLKIGKEVCVWGKADTAAITDVVSPRDHSDFIFTRLEDARLGQWMISGNYYHRGLTTFVFFSPFPEINKEPDSGTRYHRPSLPDTRYHVTPDEPGFGDVETGFRMEKTLGSTDLSFMAGRFLSNSPVYRDKGRIESGRMAVEKIYPGFTMAGAAISHARQAWLFKGEAAYKHRLPIQGLLPGNTWAVYRENRLDASLGVEYNANDRYKIILELSTLYLLSVPDYPMPGSHRFSPSIYTTFTKDFFHQTLGFEYNFYCHLKGKSRYHRVQFTYDFTDDLEIKFGYAWFWAGDEKTLMYQYRNEDRICIDLAYSW